MVTLLGPLYRRAFSSSWQKERLAIDIHKNELALKPFHERAAKAAKDHYEGYTLEQLEELKDLWKGTGNNLAPVIAKVRRPRKAA